jgi:predicted RNA polymerase sigma factor
LNRAVALSKSGESNKAMKELESIKSISELSTYHLYYITCAEVSIDLGKYPEAIQYLQGATTHSQLPSQRNLIINKIQDYGKKLS